MYICIHNEQHTIYIYERCHNFSGAVVTFFWEPPIRFTCMLERDDKLEGQKDLKKETPRNYLHVKSYHVCAASFASAITRSVLIDRS